MAQDDYDRQAFRAMVRAAAKAPDFAGWLTDILVAVTVQVGGIETLLSGRPGSWESACLEDWMRSAGCEIPEVAEGYRRWAVELKRPTARSPITHGETA